MATLLKQNVLITGGASGLGLAVARSIAAAGARVIIADFNEDAGQKVEKELHVRNHNVRFLPVDVSSTTSVAAMLRAALAWLPEGEAIDAAILSAGVNGNPFDLSPEDPSKLENGEALEALERSAATMKVNLIGVLQCVQLVVKYGMGLAPAQTTSTPAQPSVKSFTLIGSIASYRALPRAVDYSAAKWGLRGAFRSLRQQLPKIGVRINLIAPGFVKTPLLANTVPIYEQMGVNFAREEDVAEAVTRVVSDLTCSGKALAVSSQGIVELQDDAAGMDASLVVNDLVARGVLGKPGCPMGHDEQTIEFQQ